MKVGASVEGMITIDDYVRKKEFRFMLMTQTRKRMYGLIIGVCLHGHPEKYNQ